MESCDLDSWDIDNEVMENLNSWSSDPGVSFDLNEIKIDNNVFENSSKYSDNLSSSNDPSELSTNEVKQSSKKRLSDEILKKEPSTSKYMSLQTGQRKLIVQTDISKIPVIKSVNIESFPKILFSSINCGNLSNIENIIDRFYHSSCSILFKFPNSDSVQKQNSKTMFQFYKYYLECAPDLIVDCNSIRFVEHGKVSTLEWNITTTGTLSNTSYFDSYFDEKFQNNILALRSEANESKRKFIYHKVKGKTKICIHNESNKIVYYFGHCKSLYGKIVEVM